MLKVEPVQGEIVVPCHLSLEGFLIPYEHDL